MADTTPPAEPEPEQSGEDGGPGESRQGPAGVRPVGRPSQGTEDAAAIVLGFLVWLWVGLPLIQGGPKRMSAVLKAKFLNHSPHGSPLP